MVDNSMALAWTLADERSARADTVLDQVTTAGGYVPFIFRAEFANGLTMAIRQERIGNADREEALIFIETLPLMHDLAEAENVREAVRLADAHKLTVYDALYLELARRMKFPLATFDKNLRSAAQSAGIALALPAQ